MQTIVSRARPAYFQQVKDLLQLEADAIAAAAQSLDPDQVDQAVNLLLLCQGKVILTGVGKSGIVARKIAATLTSIGTSALYLHPVDALHGDLGVVSADDVVILLSNSGETDELLAMMPSLQQRQVPLIAIVGNLRSTLAQQSHVALGATVAREACPLNLAPTTSTTVALAIGDALAMTLVQIQGLTPEQFALNHPAGRLGKRLTLRVQDLMHSGQENPTISPQASWLAMVSAISEGGLGAVSVINDQGILLGVITDGDLRRAIERVDPTELASLAAIAVMTANPTTAHPQQLAYDALQVMENRPSQIAVLPVVDDQEQCIGMLRLHDLARSGLL
ncbi:MAG: KpsF/GutQ family sugar-phosphate isomerase [Leptolyngbyaceae cyanobacterium SM1_1_3]|nr:KpsF/GutQ family sugar-phosphate isomerase [Leptolyngbyaceae cyanobacterium SM1_1_3]NJN02524.1 KpsF/GutQ family sugar-phosphate isomerase [Leptolyngbyaceae cyanobacterium RM1_1_2]